MKKILVLCSIMLMLCSALCAQEHASSITSEKALILLKEGNERFTGGKRTYSDLDTFRMNEVAKVQHPYATVLSCSDSRVPVEHLFDAGIGDIFVLRDAGNTTGVTEIATLEYAVLHLNAPLIVVMGHTKCGAITAAAGSAELEGSLPEVMEMLKPALARAKVKNPSLKGEEVIEAAIVENVGLVIENINKKSPDTARLVKEGKVRIIGALYDIESGKVRWLDEKMPEVKPAR